MSEHNVASGSPPGLTADELAQESGVDLPTREAMSLVDLGGPTSRPLPIATIDDPGRPLPAPTGVPELPVTPPV